MEIYSLAVILQYQILYGNVEAVDAHNSTGIRGLIQDHIGFAYEEIDGLAIDEVTGIYIVIPVCPEVASVSVHLVISQSIVQAIDLDTCIRVIADKIASDSAVISAQGDANLVMAGDIALDFGIRILTAIDDYAMIVLASSVIFNGVIIAAGEASVEGGVLVTTLNLYAGCIRVTDYVAFDRVIAGADKPNAAVRVVHGSVADDSVSLGISQAYTAYIVLLSGVAAYDIVSGLGQSDAVDVIDSGVIRDGIGGRIGQSYSCLILAQIVIRDPGVAGLE